MKKLLIITLFMLVSSSANAAQLLSQKQVDGGYLFTFKLKLGSIQAPRNPLQQVMFFVPGNNPEQAEKIANKTAYDAEHPDQKSIDAWAQKINEKNRLQRLADKETAIRESRDAKLLNPENIIK